MSDNFHVRDLSADMGEFEFRSTDEGDGLTVSGYIARFNEPTEIEDWDGVYTESIARGAFTNTLAARGPARVKMQFNHGHDTTFGALPVGVWTGLREDRKGLFGEGRIHDTWHTAPIRAAIESGALDGMSFKFKVLDHDVKKAAKADKLDHRTLLEVNLFEAGMVVNPAYEGTTLALRGLDLCRSYLTGPPQRPVAARSPLAADMVDDEEEAVPAGGDTDPIRAEAGPASGITRREMRIRALSALGVIPVDSDRGAA